MAGQFYLLLGVCVAYTFFYRYQACYYYTNMRSRMVIIMTTVWGAKTYQLTKKEKNTEIFFYASLDDIVN